MHPHPQYPLTPKIRPGHHSQLGLAGCKKTQFFDVSEENLGQEGDESSTSSSAEDGWKLIELQGKSEGKAADSLFLTLSIVIVVVFVNRFIAQSNSSCRFANPIAKAGQDQRKDPAPAALKDGLWIVLKKHDRAFKRFGKKYVGYLSGTLLHYPLKKIQRNDLDRFHSDLNNDEL